MKWRRYARHLKLNGPRDMAIVASIITLFLLYFVKDARTRGSLRSCAGAWKRQDAGEPAGALLGILG